MKVSRSNTERLNALKKLGVQLAVDDFGTGYSSLQYLKRFPFDWLKIAKPFVDGVDGSDAQARIARAIVDLSHSLEIEVIAEGIESKRQATVLGEIGCVNGQGFHYSPPLPAEEISAYLAAGRPLASRSHPVCTRAGGLGTFPSVRRRVLDFDSSCHGRPSNSAAPPANAASAARSATSS